MREPPPNGGCHMYSTQHTTHKTQTCDWRTTAGFLYVQTFGLASTMQQVARRRRARVLCTRGAVVAAVMVGSILWLIFCLAPQVRERSSFFLIFLN